MTDDHTGTVPWRTFVTEAEHRLAAAGFASAEIDARRIVEQASGHHGAALFSGLDEPATRRGVAHFDAMLARRLTGEPLQYVLGEWSFRSLDLMVDRRVLIPRPETESVVDVALHHVDLAVAAGGDPVLVADLGTGSGAIGLAIALEREPATVWATDASSDALAVARANLAGIGRAAARVRLTQGRWFEALPDEHRGAFAVLVSNPPYIATAEPLPSEVVDWEPASALVAGPSGTEALEHLIDGARAWLRPGGALVVELAPHQAVPMADRARQAGFAEVTVHRDLVGRDRCVAATAP